MTFILPCHIPAALIKSLAAMFIRTGTAVSIPCVREAPFSNVSSTQARVAKLGSLSSGAKMAMEIFFKRVFAIFATNAPFLRVIASLQIQLSKICNIYHVKVHLLLICDKIAYVLA